MKWRTFEFRKAPGFRLNLIDIGFLLLLLIIAVACRMILPVSSLFWIPLYLAISFFIFCNVFRIGNRLEPFWYIPFTLVAGYSVYTMKLTVFWLAVLFFLEPLKWFLIVYRIKKGPYVGVTKQTSRTKQFNEKARR